MFEIKDYLECTNLEEIKNLWNDEVGFIYPLPNDIFEQNITNNKYLLKDSSYVVYINNKVVAFIITKEIFEEEMPNYQDIGFISLFYVSRYYRKLGIASELFKRVEEKFKEKNKKEIWIGRDINNFFPGVPADFDNLTGEFLGKRGYKIGGYTHDLICKNVLNQKIINTTNTYRTATIDDKEKLLEFIKNNFSGRWYFECKDYFYKGGTGSSYMIGLDPNNSIIGFFRINDCSFIEHPYNVTWYKKFNNLGGLGPLGVDKGKRGNHIGHDMLVAGINELKNRGCDDLLIDWTGLLALYQRYGFEVWKNYLYVSKSL